MGTDSYLTAGGIRVHRTVDAIPVADAIEPVIAALDDHRGVVLASSYEYPGRYTRWDMGFADPPVAVTARGRSVRVEALNARGLVLLPVLRTTLEATDAIDRVEDAADAFTATVTTPAGRFTAEERDRKSLG